MNENKKYQEVKTYTEKLLSIKDFRNHQEKINYQQRLGEVRRHLVQWNAKSGPQSTAVNLYHMQDFNKVVQKMEVGQLIKAINSKLLRLSV